MSLAATNVSEVGIHNMVLTIATQNYPAITLAKSFTAQ